MTTDFYTELNEKIDAYKNAPDLEILNQNKQYILNEVRQMTTERVTIIISQVATMIEDNSGRKKLRILELWASLQKTKKEL